MRVEYNRTRRQLTGTVCEGCKSVAEGARRSVQSRAVTRDRQARDGEHEQPESGQARPSIADPMAFQYRAAHDTQKMGDRNNAADGSRPRWHAVEREHET